MFPLLFLLSFAGPLSVTGLHEGLALTPPMGWLSWERFTCNIDCKNDPANCISERLYKDMADRMVADGYKDVGYQYVNIDDCWMEHERDEKGRLVPDRERFPNGIKALADYVHSNGLKLGIYQDVGIMTCAKYPGSLNHFDIDAATFEEWGVDMLKVDGCYADPKEMGDTYPQYSDAISKLTRPILFSCEWPLYEYQEGIKSDYKRIAKYCHMWRNFHDVNDSWGSVLSIVDYYAENQYDIVPVASPGHWNDPDMILAGNFGLSYDESVAQFLLWAVWSSPLLMSNDLRDIRKEYSDLLKNKEIIAVNQDPLGKMGKRLLKDGDIEIWARPISPFSANGDYSYAIVFFNRNNLGGPTNVDIQLRALGLANADCYATYDVFNPNVTKNYCPQDVLKVRVNPSGAKMVIAKLLKPKNSAPCLTSNGNLASLFMCLGATALIKS